MSAESTQPPDSAQDGDRRKRRRRRRRRGGGGGGGEESAQSETFSSDSGGGERDRGEREEEGGPSVSTPSSSRLGRRRRQRKRRGAAVAGLNRRRRMSRTELQELEDYVTRLPGEIQQVLYKALGGQPGRITEPERMVQLLVRAVAQGKRLFGIVRNLGEKERTALAMLIQCGGIGHSEEVLRELSQSAGGHERDWTRILTNLAELGLVCASEEKEGVFFYLVPEPLVEHMVDALEAELQVSTFKSEEVKVRDPRPFCPPMDFSVTTLCTYIDQRPPRLTQQQEIFRAHREEMDQFFAQLWDADSELFHFHIDFLMQHGLVELRGDRLAVNRDVVEEWIQLDAQDQRDLIFKALDGRFRYAEWIMWAVHSGKGEWVPERPLAALYRRWLKGDEWRRRLHKGDYNATRTNERESWTFAPLVHAGMLELGDWGQEKFYRLTPRALALVEPPENDGFSKFYLTPSFEIMAPAGLAPLLLFYCGELGELVRCDRANNYKITEVSVERALERGWKRDDILDFLREGSQIGVPINVEQTLKTWAGAGGDVELHDCVLITVHRSKIKALEGSREIKPFLLHRFVPGMYAVDRSRLPELLAVLQANGLSAGREMNRYPGDPGQVGARDRLNLLVAEAREASEDPQSRAHAADTRPEDLHPVPGTGVAKAKARKKKQMEAPRVSPREAKAVLDRALAARQSVEVLYLGKDGKRNVFKLAPERLAVNATGEQVLVAKNLESDELRTYKLIQIERIRTL